MAHIKSPMSGRGLENSLPLRWNFEKAKIVVLENEEKDECRSNINQIVFIHILSEIISLSAFCLFYEQRESLLRCKENLWESFMRSKVKQEESLLRSKKNLWESMRIFHEKRSEAKRIYENLSWEAKWNKKNLCWDAKRIFENLWESFMRSKVKQRESLLRSKSIFENLRKSFMRSKVKQEESLLRSKKNLWWEAKWSKKNLCWEANRRKKIKTELDICFKRLIHVDSIDGDCYI